MSKRNAHAVAARNRKAGPHAKPKRPEPKYDFNAWVHGSDEQEMYWDDAEEWERNELANDHEWEDYDNE